MDPLKDLFPHLNTEQINSLHHYAHLLKEANKIHNLISRKDIENIIPNHIIPSLAVSLKMQLHPSASAIDVGTGAGLPGIPLAITFPNNHFTLLDSTQKKINTINLFIKELNLNNISTSWTRIESIHSKFDFVLGRAVSNLPQFIQWTHKNIKPGNLSSLENGILYLTGSTPHHQPPIPPTNTFPLPPLLNNQFGHDKSIYHFSHSDLKACP